MTSSPIATTPPLYFDGKNIIKLGNAWPNGASANAAGINNTLQLVGTGGSGSGGGSWLYSAGTITYTGTLPGAPCIGTTLSAINNPGLAVGSTCFNRSVTFQNGRLAQLYFNDQYLGGSTTTAIATDVNDSGFITGWYKAVDSTEQGFVVNSSNGAVAYIPNLSGAASCHPVRISQPNTTTNQVWVAGNCSGPAIHLQSQHLNPDRIDLRRRQLPERGVGQ